jgi:hypothetical protein
MSDITEHRPLTEPMRPPELRIARVLADTGGRVGKAMGGAASDVLGVVRDEIGRLATLFRPELLAAGKGLAALAVAAVGGLMALALANLALLHVLTEVLPPPWGALALAGAWAAIALLGLLVARSQSARLMRLKDELMGRGPGH